MHRLGIVFFLNRGNDVLTAIFSLPAAEFTKEFVTSVVVGKDVVPRLGLHQLETLRSSLMTAINKSTDPKWKILGSSLLCCGRRKDSSKMSASPVVSIEDGGGVGGSKDVPSSTAAPVLTKHPSDTNISLSTHQPLYPPGRIIHIVRQHPKMSERQVCFVFFVHYNNIGRLGITRLRCKTVAVVFHWGSCNGAKFIFADPKVRRTEESPGPTLALNCTRNIPEMEIIHAPMNHPARRKATRVRLASTNLNPVVSFHRLGNFLFVSPASFLPLKSIQRAYSITTRAIRRGNTERKSVLPKTNSFFFFFWVLRFSCYASLPI